ncbi:GTP-binding protein [Saccharicrinis fermentans]|uniref:Hydrogenase nickel incorporation protein HypB n=1 Tax=Saccharicrinis fermentans DSM 9555 = JCM 21142 TaxID=869213 RepID=W7Y8J3_9BACT|nr:GTP-binding protein [Saccharicrinis fermentans]GAF04013.1 hydrogenase nickel incorporation protein HypB [Saccharicrinis fermentans DSM 9555 = JCM 21142]
MKTKLITIAGPPSSGKTSVIIKMIESQPGFKNHCGVIKFDCISSLDEEQYQRNGITAKTGLAGNLCPDHYFISNIDACFSWAKQNKFSTLITESAGLCNRCAPHLKEVLAICVLDNLSGINTPLKTGPMVKMADIVVVTKSDLVSQAEREVFRFKIQQVNSKCKVLFINGITGQGADRLATLTSSAKGFENTDNLKLRFSMPTALCSYCLGETRVDQDFQIGINRKIKL